MILGKSYLGSTEITKAYLGSNVVYEAGGGGGIPTANLFAYYGFNGDTLDAVGINDGTLVSGAALTTTNPKTSTGAVEFTSGTSYVNLGISSDFTLTDGIDVNRNDRAGSFSFWFNAETNKNSVFIFLGSVTVLREYLIFFTGGNLYFNLYGTTNDDSIRIIHPYTLPLNEWHHITATYNGDYTSSNFGLNLYIDKVKVSTPAVQLGTYTGQTRRGYDLVLGKFGVNIDYTLDGKMDGVGFWDKELSQEEVTAIYDEQNLGNELI